MQRDGICDQSVSSADVPEESSRRSVQQLKNSIRWNEYDKMDTWVSAERKEWKCRLQGTVGIKAS